MSESQRPADVEQVLERLFPWYCPRCRRKEVQRTTIAYECQRVHDGQTITVRIPELAVPRCGNCGQLVFDYVAEAQINQAIREFLAAPAGSLNGGGEEGVAPVEIGTAPPHL